MSYDGFFLCGKDRPCRALTFIAMLVPVLKGRPAIAAALSAGAVALVAFSLPYKLGLILAALVGILVGTVLEGRKPAGGAA